MEERRPVLVVRDKFGRDNLVCSDGTTWRLEERENRMRWVRVAELPAADAE